MTLKTLIRRKKITQADLGQKLGLTQGTVSKYINGTLSLSADVAAKIGRITSTNPVPLTNGEFTFRTREASA